jgi:NAD(P)-dependent dehydrogenase (short-subunit alcohol dehydrogenase family)
MAAAPAPSDNERVVVITGGTGGIGFHSAVAIARTGARVIVTGRDRERGEAAVRKMIDASDNAQCELVVGNISSIASVDALARDIMDRTSRISVLVNNAGYLGNTKEVSEDGLEMHFAVNVLSPWRLTHALLPALKAAGTARVVNLTAGDNAPGTQVPLDANNLQAEKGFRGLLTMAHSKSAMESMSLALAKELENDGITVNVVFPGRASTAMTRSLSLKGLPGPMKLFMPCMMCLFRKDGGKGAARCAKSTVFAATDPEVSGLTGKYFGSNTKELKPHRKAADPEAQQRILDVLNAVAPSATPGL